jgi:hypothetical protein
MFGIIFPNPGKLGTAEAKLVFTQILTVSPLSNVVSGPGPLIKHVLNPGFGGEKPGELQIDLIIGSVEPLQAVKERVALQGGLAPEQVVFIIVGALGVTTATLAPCLAAFLIEFFVYQALANSSIPRTIKRSNKSISAVSINV